MKAVGRNFNILFSGKIEYIIPFFQRKYVWTESNWKELIDNLSSSDTNFFGSIILKTFTDAEPGKQQFHVIDGQQRLTTISVLLRAILDVVPEEKLIEQDIKIKSLLLSKDTGAKWGKPKITHSYYDSKAFNEVMQGKCDIENVNEESHLIEKCYKFFIETFTNYLSVDVNKILEIYSKLTDEECIVSITLSEHDNEQIIFNTINNAGVKLSNADTIKNDIFQKAIELAKKHEASKNEVIEIYDSTWGSEFDTDRAKIMFWDTQTSVGRKMKTHLEKFLYAFAVIKDVYDPNKYKVEQLAKAYSEFIANLDFEQIKNFINELAGYAKTYFDIWNEYDENKISFDDIYSRLFLIFDKFDTSTFNSYVLYCAKNMNEESAQKNLHQLEKYLIKGMIVGSTTKNYNKECAIMLDDDTWLDRKLASEEFSDDQIRQGLKNIKKNNKAALILFIVELYHRTFSGYSGEKSMAYKYTLEHIMPQKWNDYWSINQLPVYDENSSLIIDEIYAKTYRQNHIYSIGNMTLLSKALNSSIKNKNFATKMKGTDKIKGIIKLSNLSITQPVVEIYNSDQNGWNENQIIRREELLYQDIIKIWPKD